MIWIVWGIIHILIYHYGIKWFHKYQFHQQIYEDSPAHHQNKKNTPTMGGIFIALSFLSGVVILNNWSWPVIFTVFVSCMFFIIGVVDDSISLIKKRNKGLSAKVKFLLQVAISTVAILILHIFIREVSIFEWILYVFLLTGSSNATNLTDGVDGLLSSTMIVSLIGVALIMNQFLLFQESALSVLMIGCLFLFLIFNWTPAKIFMGDAGSLMLGAFLASVCIVSGNWIILIGFGAIYVIETLSVMIQVAIFKLKSKRVYLMTPLHHHFELLGMNDRGVVLLFVSIQIAFTAIQVML